MREIKDLVSSEQWSRSELANDPRWDQLYAASGPQSSILQQRIKSFLASDQQLVSDQAIVDFVSQLPEEVEAQKVLDRLASWRLSFLSGVILSNQAIVQGSALDQEERKFIADRVEETRRALDGGDQQLRQEVIDQLQEYIAECQHELEEGSRFPQYWETVEDFCQALAYTLEREEQYPELEVEAVQRAIESLVARPGAARLAINSFREAERDHLAVMLRSE